MCYVVLMNEKHLCTATTRSGRPCRAWAIHGTEPPRCIAHALDPLPGPAEPAPVDRSLLDREIATTRLVLTRLLDQIETEPPPAARDLARLAPLIFHGTATVARLLRIRRALSGETVDGLAGAVAQALDELSTEWQVDL